MDQVPLEESEFTKRDLNFGFREENPLLASVETGEKERDKGVLTYAFQVGSSVKVASLSDK